MASTRMVYRLRLASVRPQVRYVDQDQAVIDVHVTMYRTSFGRTIEPLDAANLELHLQMTGSEGLALEDRHPLTLHGETGMARFVMIAPQRWWPAGMGLQTLYELSVWLVSGDEVLDTAKTTLGLTSVRPALSPQLLSATTLPDAAPAHRADQAALLVNGEFYPIHLVLPIEPVDERQVLPVPEDSLLVVRNHFGPDDLYNAADRAGVLLIQSVPSPLPSTLPMPARSRKPAASEPVVPPADELLAQIHRLTTHPSLAGWLVDWVSDLSDHLIAQLRTLDPSRAVFRHLPGYG